MVDNLKKEVPTDDKSAKLDSIQREVIELLGNISTLIENTKVSLVDGNANPKYNQFQQQFSNVSDNIADLQLRMAIIAPMKAGKSTIINAIAGQELLPSCATAMTTIPTEIVFSANLTEPVLYLQAETIEVFQRIYQQINQKIASSGIESLQQSLARYPHLIYLLTEIKDSPDVPFKKETQGQTAIQETLNLLNQIIRLYSVVEPLAEPLAELTTIPQISTPFLGLAGVEQVKNFGELVIVDTPGPNEAGVNSQLTGVVEEQLRRSSIILLVLDYTQLNNEAAESIKEQVKPVLDLIGQDNLYVIVNKIDQRRRGDITSEQVKDFVIADLNLESKNIEQRIFEVSAIRAFAATQFLLEIKQKPQAQLLELNSLETLAQEVFGIDWDEEIEDINLKILTKKARKLWKKSGFAPFLEQAITKLLESAAPRSLIAALNLSRHRLLELRDDINLRGKAMTESKAKLKQEIQSLESDLAYLETCRNHLKQVEYIKAKLKNNLEQIITDLKQQAKVNLENYFAEQEYEKGDLIKKADIKTRELLLTNIGDFNLLPQFLSKNIKSNLEPKTTGIINFSTGKEAEKFNQEALLCAKQRLEKLLLLTRQKIETEIITTNKDLKEFLEKETQPVIERAQIRLKKSFAINLELPSPTITPEEELPSEEHLIKKKTRLVESGYEECVVKKRAWYYWFGIVPFYSQELQQKPYKRENYYSISVYELVKQINFSNDKLIEEIKQKLLNYLEEDIQQQVDSFFTNLDDYLGSYLKNIKQAQKTRELSLEQRTKVVKILYCLVPETTSYIEKTNNYLQIAEQLISVNSKQL
ncbi:Dynamin family protein [Hyella patelloides LEGE 07179]|uniref:Dynamin family protein n=1 Tax=Hyella patelloides LEGE 07179 TaxID=945734 RepID=A0A563W3K2_9CYAN|nr:dynamin family protein [Hyella patelloides]VEP18262.1 Dynamin family protein [Hyella patelloides LEGE 07179]